MRHLASSTLALLLALAVPGLTSAQIPLPPAPPPLPTIDLPDSQLDSGLVTGHPLSLPSPPEFLFVLQKTGSPKWRQLYHPVIGGQESDRSKTALRLGLNIAEAHLAAMARDAQKIRDVTNDLQRYAKILGISDALADNVRSINQLADAKAWAGVAYELESLSTQTSNTLRAQRDAKLAQLITTGLWVRLLQVSSNVVCEKEFTDTSLAISSCWTLDQLVLLNGDSEEPTTVSICDQLAKLQRLWAPEKLAAGHHFDDDLIAESRGRIESVIQLFVR